jgi:hypothetical protein
LRQNEDEACPRGLCPKTYPRTQNNTNNNTNNKGRELRMEEYALAILSGALAALSVALWLKLQRISRKQNDIFDVLLFFLHGRNLETSHLFFLDDERDSRPRD